MSRISNERIKFLTINECNRYSKARSKESKRINKQTADNFHNSYKSSLK